MLTLTLDTSVIREYWDVRPQYDLVTRLIKLSDEGVVDLKVTARIHEDIPDHPLSTKINTLPLLGIGEVGSVTRLGHWVLGRDMLVGDDGFEEARQELSALAMERTSSRQRGKSPDMWDWDHLHAHMLLQRDHFVTLDRPLLSIAPELKSRFFYYSRLGRGAGNIRR